MISVSSVIKAKKRRKIKALRVRIKNSLRYGFEIEGYYTGGKDCVIVDRFATHYDDICNFKEDGSLDGWYDVSGVFLEAATRVLDMGQYEEENRKVIEFLQSKFNDVFFNKSMGLHMHFSFKDKYVLKVFNNYALHRLLRTTFRQKIKKADFLTEYDKDYIIRRYFRRYACRGVGYGDNRYYSLHACTRLDTLEWRSPCLGNNRGFFVLQKFLNLLCDALIEAIVKYFKRYKYYNEFEIWRHRAEEKRSALEQGTFLDFLRLIEEVL